MLGPGTKINFINLPGKNAIIARIPFNPPFNHLGQDHEQRTKK